LTGAGQARYSSNSRTTRGWCGSVWEREFRRRCMRELKSGSAVREVDRALWGGREAAGSSHLLWCDSSHATLSGYLCREVGRHLSSWRSRGDLVTRARCDVDVTLVDVRPPARRSRIRDHAHARPCAYATMHNGTRASRTVSTWRVGHCMESAFCISFRLLVLCAWAQLVVRW